MQILKTHLKKYEEIPNGPFQLFICSSLKLISSDLNGVLRNNYHHRTSINREKGIVKSVDHVFEEKKNGKAAIFTPFKTIKKQQRRMIYLGITLEQCINR